MHIKKVVSQYRRDMTVVYECEHCGLTYEGSAYDDDNYHRNVVPNMICANCHRQAGEDYRPLGAKYPEGYPV